MAPLLAQTWVLEALGAHRGTSVPLCAHELTPGQRHSNGSASEGLLLETCPAPLLSQGVWGSLRFFLYLISKKKKKS